MSNPEISEFTGVQATSSPKETTSMTSAMNRFQSHLMRRMDSLLDAIRASPEADYSYVKECTEQLRTIVSAYESRHASLLETVDAGQWEEEEKRYEEFDRRRFEVSVVLKRRETELCVRNTDMLETGVSNSKSKVRLPEIPLPKFDGAWETWPTFRDSFISLIDGQPRLSEVDKLIYLKRVVAKEAAQLIDAVETTAANYSVAWSLLKNRYENKKVLVRRYLDELFAISPATKDCYETLTTLIDGFDRTIKMVEKLGISTSGWSVLLAHMLGDKLDPATRKEWETYHRSTEVAQYEEMVKFLREHALVLQALPRRLSKEPSHTNTNSRPKWKPTCAAVNVIQKKCVFCEMDAHSAFKCNTFRNLPVHQRYDKVKEKGLCINCLASDHRVKDCTSSACRVCKLKHHTMLHRSPNEQPPSPNVRVPETTMPSSASPYIEPANNVMLAPAERQPEPLTTVLLPTVLVTIITSSGNKMIARALLDGGAQVNLITERVVQGLRAQRNRDHLSIGAVGKSNQTSSHSVNVVIQSQCTNVQFPLRLHVLPEIMWNLPAAKVDKQQWELPPNIRLADPTCGEVGAIDMLLGREVYNEILLDGLFRLRSGDNSLMLQETRLGWVVSGRAPIEGSCVPRSFVNTTIITESLDEQLCKFWELESCQSSNTLSPEDSQCESMFKESTTRGSDGRFVVALPKDEMKIRKLGGSYEIAKRRLHSLNRRLNANPGLKTQYQDFLDEYLRLGHMEEIGIEPIRDSPTYYMPHHCIVRPDSLTTKLRVVFDASCATDSGVSLNEALLVGPVIQDDLISIIMRFRFPRYALTADIEKMYTQIWISDDDQPLQRILWGDEASGIRKFQLKTVTYGTASAPYLATKCLQALANDASLSHPIASKILSTDFYMDDLISGVDTINQGRLLCRELSELLQSAGFHLRKWASNAAQILNTLPPDLREMGAELLIDPHKSIKTLGLKWIPAQDKLTFSIPNWHKDDQITKRTVVSDAARLYDPLGLIGPIIVIAKCFLQVLWERGVEWDEPLEEKLREKWMHFKQGIVDIGDIAVPRRVVMEDADTIEVHGFSDASEKAYGACIYIRTITADGRISVELLCAKSRVAPIENGKRQRRVTLPRLELSGALLLCHLWQKVKLSTKREMKTVFWVDSTIVLHWIAGNPSQWKPFVANRVSEIQHITDKNQWHHVPGEENPADIISRGMLPSELKNSDVWWHGPKWLSQQIQWAPPASIPDARFTAEQLEERVVVSAVKSKGPSPVFLLRSSYSALVRLVAYILRFRYNCQRLNRYQRRKGLLTLYELHQATKVLVRLSQSETFGEEIVSLKEGQVKATSKMKSLAPILVDGIICIGGRLRNAPVSDSRKHPIILDPNHPLSLLIMNSYHRQFLHAGPQLLTSLVREKFWPLRVRNLARKVVHRCVKCYRNKPTCMEQLMGDLPPERVTPTYPFLNTGVDLCGPFWYRYAPRKATPVKGYVAVFVCFVTKAVHVELVADLSTQAFLAALKRFVARRGKPALIECDNAKNFRGAARELKELYESLKTQQAQEVITNHCTNEGIEFKFIPPRSPNFGGLWEAAIKSLKKHLKCTIGATILLKEDLETLLIQIEACLNSRPLTQLSTDPEDLEALTPGHFLIHRSLVSTPEPSYENVNFNRLDRFQKIQEFVRRIWKQWKTDYLSGLHPRTKWTRQSANIDVRTLVLLKEDNLPPLKWAVGRITRIFRGNDGNIRVVEVRMKEGVYRRAISKICILPVQEEK